MTQMQTLKAELMQSNNIYQTQKARLTGSEAGEGQNEKTSNTGKTNPKVQRQEIHSPKSRQGSEA